MATAKAEILISAIDRVSAPVRKMNAQLRSITEPLRRVNSAVGALGREAGVGKLTHRFKELGKAVEGVKSRVSGLASKFTAIAGVAAFSLVGGLLGGTIKTNAEFERFQTILTTITGSSAKAKASMDWIDAFTKRTPYELAEVTDAFIKLKGYGIDATDGTLAILGDASAAMGKQLDDTVEMLSDAQMGEFERMKAFNLKGSVKGNIVSIAFSDKDGKKRAFTAAKNDSDALRKIVLEAFKAKGFSGAMANLSSTWDGMWSNMKDTVAGVFRMIGNAGAFDYFKAKLKQVLDLFDRLTKSGQLQKWATAISAAMTQVGGVIEAKLKAVDWAAVWQGLQDFGATVGFIIDLVGGLGNAIQIVALIMAGPALASIGVLIGQIVALGGVLAANPVLLIMAAIAAVALLIITNWGPISRFFGDIWARVVAVWQGAVAWFQKLWAGIKAQFVNGLMGVMGLLLSFSPVGLIAQAVNAVLKYFTGVDLFAVGAQFIGSLWEGIKSKWAGLTAWLSGAMQTLMGWLPDWAKKRLGITAPTMALTAPKAVTSAATRPVANVTRAMTRPAAAVPNAMRPAPSIIAAANPATTGMAAGVPQLQSRSAPAVAAPGAGGGARQVHAPVNVNMNFNGISDVEAVRRIAMEAVRTALREWEDRQRSDRLSAMHG